MMDGENWNHNKSSFGNCDVCVENFVIFWRFSQNMRAWSIKSKGFCEIILTWIIEIWMWIICFSYHRQPYANISFPASLRKWIRHCVSLERFWFLGVVYLELRDALLEGRAQSLRCNYWFQILPNEPKSKFWSRLLTLFGLTSDKPNETFEDNIFLQNLSKNLNYIKKKPEGIITSKECNPLLMIINLHWAANSLKLIFPSSFVPLSLIFSNKSMMSFRSILFSKR